MQGDGASFPGLDDLLSLQVSKDRPIRPQQCCRTSFRWSDLRHGSARKLTMYSADLNSIRSYSAAQALIMTRRYARLALNIKWTLSPHYWSRIMKKKRSRIRFDWYLRSFLVPFLLGRRADPQTAESTRYSESEILSVVLDAAEHENSGQINVHAATAAFRLLLEQIDEVNAGHRKNISKKLVNYFRPRFLEIIVYGHSYVVSDGRYRMPRELDLNTLFGVPRKRGREKDVSLFQRLDTAYRVQHRMDAAERAGKTLSLTSLPDKLANESIAGREPLAISIVSLPTY